MPVQYVLQKSSNPAIYYKEKRGPWQPKIGASTILVEVSQVEKATKFTSLKVLNKTLEKVFHNKIKAHLTDLSDGVKIIRCETAIVYTEESKLDQETQSLVDALQTSSKLINGTHYSTIELFNKIRRDPDLADYKYILSTSYDSMYTSKLYDMYIEHGLEPIKHKGNFAFNREDYWTAAKLICDVPYKSFNLT